LSYGRNRLLVIVAGAIFTYLGYSLFVANLLDRLTTNYADYESQGAAVRLVMNAVPATLFFLIRMRLPIDVSERTMWRNLALLALASAILVFEVESTTALDRLGLYLIPLQLFVFSWIPSVFSEDGAPDRKLAILVIIYSAVVLFVWLTYAAHAEYWLPYRLWPFFHEG
jgi:hypothetical protein